MKVDCKNWYSLM